MRIGRLGKKVHNESHNDYSEIIPNKIANAFKIIGDLFSIFILKWEA